MRLRIQAFQHRVVSFLIIQTCLSQHLPYTKPLTRVNGVSYESCRMQCGKTIGCSFTSYKRRALQCELYKEFPASSAHVPGLKISSLLTRTPVCSACTENKVCVTTDAGVVTCEIERCNILEDIPGADIYGNIITVWSRAQYRCRESGLVFPVTCLADGVWSETKFLSCNCKVPDNIAHATLEYEILNETFIKLVQHCEPGYYLLEIEPLKCNVLTGEWFNVHLSFCCMLTNHSWRKVYSYKYSKSIYGSWKSGMFFINDTMPDGQFRNSSILDNWSTMVRRRVRFDIMQDGQVVKYLMFNGTDTDNLNWFSRARLLNSSWSDLNSGVQTDIFAIVGLHAPNNALFYIGKTVDSSYNCNTDTGWFVVSWAFYPCDVYMKGITMLYAKGDSASLFHSTEVGFADRFEVSIEEWC